MEDYIVFAVTMVATGILYNVIRFLWTRRINKKYLSTVHWHGNVGFSGGRLMNKCSKCGETLVKDKSHYIPIGTDSILRIVGCTCPVCGGVVVDENQEMEVIKNRDLHDKLIEYMEPKN